MEFETRYVISNEHAPDECEASFAGWQALHKEHPGLAIIPESVVCGCPNGDHRGSYVLTDEGDARIALRYETTGKADLATWVQVPVPDAA